MSVIAEVRPPFDDPSPRHVLMQQVASTRTSAGPSKDTEKTFGFGDIIDVINPLQHIPGLSDLYRAATNDEISDEARKTGRSLYSFALGGPVGIGLMMAFDAFTGGTAAEAAAAPRTAAQDPAPANPVAASSVSVDPEGTEPDPAETAAGILGAQVASTGLKTSGLPLDLAQFGPASAMPPEIAASARKQDNQAAAPLAGTTGGQGISTDQAEPVSAVPDEAGLGRIATHKSNHLSLDVLKVLQERHAKLAASEQS